jgi:hypothetical protein
MAAPDPDDLADEDLRGLVEDLDRTLSTLRDELERRDDTASPAQRTGSGRRRQRGLRPPSPSELFRFTEQHTIPTLISTLEATIRSLELLRSVLRLVDPERSALDPRDARDPGASSTARLSDGVADLGRGAASGVERALSELQRALSESDLPDDEPSRELLEDARQLSEEVSARLSASGERGDAYAARGASGREHRETDVAERTDSDGRADTDRRTTHTTEAVEIDVTGPQTDPGADASNGDDEHHSAEEKATPEVDVEAELESIKDEVAGGTGRVDPTADSDEDADGETDSADHETGDADSHPADATSHATDADSHPADADSTSDDGESDTEDAENPADSSDTADST